MHEPDDDGVLLTAAARQHVIGAQHVQQFQDDRGKREESDTNFQHWIAPILGRQSPQQRCRALRNTHRYNTSNARTRPYITRLGKERRLHDITALRMTSGSAMTGSRSQFLAMAGRGRRLCHDRLVLESREGAAIEIVKVPADLELAVVVDKGGLISEVQPDRGGLGRDLLLGTTKHALDPRGRPVLLGPSEGEN